MKKAPKTIQQSCWKRRRSGLPLTTRPRSANLTRIILRRKLLKQTMIFFVFSFLPEQEVEVHRVEVDNDDGPSCQLKSVAPEHLILLQEDDRQQGEPADWRQDSFRTKLVKKITQFFQIFLFCTKTTISQENLLIGFLGQMWPGNDFLYIEVLFSIS